MKIYSVYNKKTAFYCLLLTIILSLFLNCKIFAKEVNLNLSHKDATNQKGVINYAPTTNNINIDSFLEDKPWSVLFYVGGTAKQPLARVVRFQYTSVGETLYTAELAYSLSKNNLIKRFLSPVVNTIQIANNITYRDDKNDIRGTWEYDLYMIFRWTKFPWRNYLYTSFGAAEGISYASRVPLVEQGITSSDSRRLLNYLMFELTFALPSHPNIQLIARIHHRSTAYGVYGNDNSGSNNVGIGIRYYF